jgi:deoxycytidine triphosphate deaminase
MSIKSDKWIRMMATEYGMIEPYEPGQVKQVDGKRIVSYGTSSYGYDIRCADEFKLFTNINSTIVDPKEFDENNFIDFKGSSVIIPPNSFALARTVEYFRIPRNVLTICLGKSTYARCGILGRLCDAGVFQHDPLACEDLRQRRRRPGGLLRIRRSLRNLLQRSRRQIPGPTRCDAAEDVVQDAINIRTASLQTT